MSVREYLYVAPWFLPFRVLLSFVYGLVTWLRNTLYDIHFLKVYQVKTPVISVGNISVGGSGKTILVQSILEHFLKLNKRPAVLSRGYGRTTKGLVLVADNEGLKASPETGGDEPCLVAMNFPGIPVVVSEDRVLGAEYLHTHFAPDVIILDDGFQHRRLARDLNILIQDSPAVDQEKLLPWGRLREPVRSLKRADIIVHSKAGEHADPQQNMRLELSQDVIDGQGQKHRARDLSGQLGLFAGIANPQHFFHGAEQLTHPVKASLVFPDHVHYGPSEKARIVAKKCDHWLTTQKDFIKLDPDFCQQNSIYYCTLKASLPELLSARLKQDFN